MKKRVCLFCCVVGLLLPTTAHGETVQASQNNLPQVLCVADYRLLYITQPSSVKEFCDLWEQWWKTGKRQNLAMGNKIIP